MQLAFNTPITLMAASALLDGLDKIATFPLFSQGLEIHGSEAIYK